MFALVPRMFDFFGLSRLSDVDKSSLLRAFYVDLEFRVGSRLAYGLTERELSDFEEIMAYLQAHSATPEDDPSQAWLEHVRPDYRGVVLDCVRELLAEVLAKSDRIARIAEIERGELSRDPVSDAFEAMQQTSTRLRRGEGGATR